MEDLLQVARRAVRVLATNDRLVGRLLTLVVSVEVSLTEGFEKTRRSNYRRPCLQRQCEKSPVQTQGLGRSAS